MKKARRAKPDEPFCLGNGDQAPSTRAIAMNCMPRATAMLAVRVTATMATSFQNIDPAHSVSMDFLCCTCEMIANATRAIMIAVFAFSKWTIAIVKTTLRLGYLEKVASTRDR
jgi:hypothetical protein